MFVYGTLRTGGYIHEAYFSPEQSATAVRAKMPGSLYTLGSFPCMVPDERAKEGYGYEPVGMVVGEIVTVDPETFRRIALMELRAGYYVDSLPATRPTGGRDWCLVFLVNEEDVEGLPRLPGDDFFRQDEIEGLPPGRGFFTAG